MLRISLDSSAWHAGYQAGLDGKGSRCPYRFDSDEALAWSSGYIEGQAARYNRATTKDAA